jgi:hypothetical protein
MHNSEFMDVPHTKTMVNFSEIGLGLVGSSSEPNGSQQLHESFSLSRGIAKAQTPIETCWAIEIAIGEEEMRVFNSDSVCRCKAHVAAMQEFVIGGHYNLRVPGSEIT